LVVRWRANPAPPAFVANHTGVKKPLLGAVLNEA
jgi:hypothetical protein